MEPPPPSELPAAPETSAQCAVHERAQATGTCERCGNFVCPLCLDPESAIPDRCEACRERVGSDRMAWEHPEGGWLGRWWLTTKDLLRRPTRTIERIQPGSIGAALTFATVTGLLQGIALGVLGAIFVGLAMASLPTLYEDALPEVRSLLGAMALGGTLGAPLIVATGVLGQALLRGLVYHLGVALARGDGGVGASLWVSGYLSAIYVLAAPLALSLAVPLIGPLLFLLMLLAIEIWQAVHLTTAARRFHHLEGGRAAFAGWFPFVTTAVVGGGCCALYLGAIALAVLATAPA